MDYKEKAMEMHAQWAGKIEVVSRAKVENTDDLSIAYTPGVAEPCLAIKKNPELQYTLTRRHNMVAVITDGSAVLPIDRELIHESLVEFGFEGYDEVLAAQQGKPLYMPDLKTFLKYGDEDYYEETSATKALRQFFQKTLHRSREDAEELLLETILVVRCEYRNPMQAAFDDFARMQIPMTFREAQQLGELLKNLNNTTRNPYNRGFTPEELHQREGNRKPKSISFGSNLTAQFSDGTLDAREWMQKVMQDDTLSDDMRGMLLAELMKQQGSISDKTPAPSRNGLCPCGSGKKYKRCCGKK